MGREKQVFQPLDPSQVRIYTCGPTVYSHTHLGHMRTYSNTDVLLRTLRYFDYQPFQVMNITDVGHLTDDGDSGEDKMEKAAREEQLDAWQLAEKYQAEFEAVIKELNIDRPDVLPKATENIEQMIAVVQVLEQKGYTYQTSDGLYFDTSKLADYGKLANVSLEDLQPGARVEMSEEKRNKTDFALWKFSPPEVKRQMEWASPWAEKSFPGWHIECATMAMRFLSDCFVDGEFYPERFTTIDIHGGGIEHINVHHTNEIAEVKAATGKQLARFWVHNNWLQVDGEKMSKSKGNFYTRQDLANRGYENLMPLRYLFLQTHYRKKMNFTWEALAGAKQGYQSLVDKVQVSLSAAKKGAGEGKLTDYREQFRLALADDLNTSKALAVFHGVLDDSSLPSGSGARLIKEFDQVLGLGLVAAGRQRQIPAEIKQLAARREKLRREEKWEEADRLREKILLQGFRVEDTPEGPQIYPCSNG